MVKRERKLREQGEERYWKRKVKREVRERQHEGEFPVPPAAL